MSTCRIQIRWSLLVVLAAFVLQGFLLLWVTSAYGQNYAKYRVDGKRLTRQERWVLEQVAADMVADLMGKFVLPRISEEEDLKEAKELGLTGYLNYLKKESSSKANAFQHDIDKKIHISAKFLQQLLTGSFPDFKIKQHGVRITNAIIEGPLNLEGTEVNCHVEITGCIFKEQLFFSDSAFKRSLFLKKCHFLNKADLDGIEVAKDIRFDEGEFYGQLVIRNANIKGQFGAKKAKFFNKKEKANFNGIKVGGMTSFEKAEFHWQVDFTGSQLGDQFDARETKYLSKEQEASFNGMKVAKLTSFQKAEFHGPVDFGSAESKGQFIAKGAKFESQDHKANFNSTKVGEIAFFNDAVFHGPVNFVGADIGGDFNASGAQFNSTEQEVIFDGIHIGGRGIFCEAIFKGPVSFFAMRVENGFTIRPPKGGAGKRAEFHASVDFGGCKIGWQFNIRGAQFKSKEHIANFSGMEVGQIAVFNEAEFHGPVDLRFGSFQLLEFNDVNYPAVLLEGMTYKNILAGADWKNLLKLLKKSTYHSQPYSQLETFLKQTGYPERADEVFITGKRRVMKESWNWWKPWQWPGKILETILLDWGVGYGRHPGRIIYYSAFFIFLGTVIFLQPAVLTWEGGEAEKKIKLKQAFWFSLDAYLPFVSLGPDKFYQLNRDTLISLAIFLPKGLTSRFPKGLQDWLTNRHLAGTTYFYLHQLAGYVFVSIGIAAVTGIVK